MAKHKKEARVAKDQGTVRIRLSKAQIAMIWPGLDFIVSAYLLQDDRESLRTSYPYRLYPKQPDADHGAFSTSMMDRIRGLRAALRAKRKKGGQLWMDFIELRAAALAVRITLKLLRMKAHGQLGRAKDVERWQRTGRVEIKKHEGKARRIVQFLELRMKRANRRFLAQGSQEVFSARSKEWQAHLKWIRFNLAYFKPLPPVAPGMRKQYQRTIEKLETKARQVIKNEGFLPPNPNELRRAIRQFVRYSRRARIGLYYHRKVLENWESFDARFSFFKFLERRLDLKGTR